MTESAEREATYEDLMQVPPHRVAEILGGKLYSHPRPSPKHARSSSVLGGALFEPFDRGGSGPGGWLIFDEPELHLGSEVLVPDLAGWRRERMPELPETAWFEIAPDWVCEILSPSTAQIDRSLKLPVYARQGVEHLWLIDPELRTLEAYVIRDGQWLLLTTLREDEQVRTPPFDAITFRLSILWS